MNNFVGLGTISIDKVVMLIGSIVGLWDLTIVDCRSCHLMVVWSLDIGVSNVGQGWRVVDDGSVCVSGHGAVAGRAAARLHLASAQQFCGDRECARVRDGR